MSNLLKYKEELYRKLFHISSSIIPILLYFTGKEFFLPYILIAAILLSLIDYLRRYSSFLYLIADMFFRKITRPSEVCKITGASWVLIGSGITIFLFNEGIAITSLLIMSISDSLAAIIGIKYGATKLFNKSLEGSSAFFISSVILIILFTSLPLLIVFIISIILTFIELYSTEQFNDNVFVPMFAGLLLTIGGLV
tara:strand:- start:1650 stop:2237 length:588 start_codon:yes stop_codon:yes gene_type:complete